MAVTPDDVRRLARLAHLRFTDAEAERLAGEMARIVRYVDKLGELDTAGVSPLVHVLDRPDVTREDVPDARLTRDDALRNAPTSDADGHVTVPNVME
jgi:aspartyl-tRNA(Asn)/glutamyl-tRNA(Gln) amidotransferase subunit C